MKTLPTALAAHYQQEVTTIATCLKVTRADSTVYGFTDTDNPVVIDGVTYVPGFDLSALESTATLAVDQMELTILPNEAVYPIADILAGKWIGATFEIVAVNYMSVADGVDILKVGTIGQFKERRSSYVVEFRGLTQSMQAKQSASTSKTCRARLGDAKCKKDLTAFTYTSTITAVADKRHVTDSARTEADEWFVEGLFTFNNGPNAGLTQKVKVFASGAFTFCLPFPFLPVVGNAYTAIAGCQHRHEITLANPGGISDCKTKFNNVPNFQGEPHLPGQDAITSPPTTPAQPASTPAIPAEGATYTESGL